MNMMMCVSQVHDSFVGSTLSEHVCLSFYLSSSV